jgi:hypothetical protein
VPQFGTKKQEEFTSILSKANKYVATVGFETHDKAGRPLYDKEGRPLCDENGRPLFDENGLPIYKVSFCCSSFEVRVSDIARQLQLMPDPIVDNNKLITWLESVKDGKDPAKLDKIIEVYRAFIIAQISVRRYNDMVTLLYSKKSKSNL